MRILPQEVSMLLGLINIATLTTPHLFLYGLSLTEPDGGVARPTAEEIAHGPIA